MRVVVCVKEIGRLAGPVRIEPDQRLAPGSLQADLNPNDRFALEEALRLRGRGTAGEVVALSAGEGGLARTAALSRAMGVDRVVRLATPALPGLDAFGWGRVLARAIATLHADLVLCGHRSADEGSGLVPVAIAAELGWPYVSQGAAIQVAAGAATVERKLERGARARWRVPLPAVVACAEDINMPRYVSVAAEVLARRAVPEALAWSALGLDPAALTPRLALGARRPARPRPKKTASSALGQSTADKLQMILSGGVTAKQDKRVLRGDPGQVAEEVFAFLHARGLLARRAAARRESAQHR